MGLETAGNIAALFGGAVKGYQDQSEIELKKQQLARDEELKRLQIEAGLMEKGLIKSANGGWEYSPEELDKRKLDRDYKQAQIDYTKARAEYSLGGGSELQAAKLGFIKDPLGNLVESDYLKQKRQQELDYQAAQAKKALGLVNVPEAASVAALNQQKVTEAAAKLRDEYGIEIGPKGEVIKIEGWVKPWTKGELEERKDYRDQGFDYNPRTKEKTPIKGWKSKQDKQDKPSKPKTLPATQAVNLSSGKAAVQALEDLKGIIEKNKHEFGFKRGLLNKGKAIFGGEKGTTARTIQSDLQTRGQILSKFLEQGKLSDKDRDFYLGQVPTLTDSPESAFNKISTLSRIVQQLHNQNIEGFDAAGYDVSKFTDIPLTEIRTLKTEQYDAKTKETIDLARKAINSKSSTEQQKTNARNFLKSKGIQ